MEEDKQMQDETVKKQYRIRIAEQETEVFLYPDSGSRLEKKSSYGRRKSYGKTLASILKEDYMETTKLSVQVGEPPGNNCCFIR